MSSNLVAPVAAGAAVGASAAATAAAGAACAAAAAALTAAGATLLISLSNCVCSKCTPKPPVRTPAKKPVEITKTPSGRAQEEAAVAETPAEPVTPRTLSDIESDNELLPRSRAAEHLLHAIAEANEGLVTAGLVARAGWDAKLSQPDGLPRWDFGGCSFAKSEAVGVIGAAVVATAPLAIPSNAVFGAGVAITQGVSLLFGAKGEVVRALSQETFLRRYGLRREELKWSVLPISTLYWDLAPGDSLLELCLKAKRGLLGIADLGNTGDLVVQLKLRRLLCKLLDCLPGTTAERAALLDAAIRKAASDMAGGAASSSSSSSQDVTDRDDGNSSSSSKKSSRLSPAAATSAARLEKAFREAAAEIGHPEVSKQLEELAHTA